MSPPRQKINSTILYWVPNFLLPLDLYQFKNSINRYSRRKISKLKNFETLNFYRNQRQKIFDPGINKRLKFFQWGRTSFAVWGSLVWSLKGRKMRSIQLDRIRYTDTELKWKENVKNIGTGDLRHRLIYLQLQSSCLLQAVLWSRTFLSDFFSERHLTIFDEISKLAEVIVTDGDLNKIDKMYQIRFINFEGESW